MSALYKGIHLSDNNYATKSKSYWVTYIHGFHESASQSVRMFVTIYVFIV